MTTKTIAGQLHHTSGITAELQTLIDATANIINARIGTAASVSGTIGTSIDTDGTLKAGAVDEMGVIVDGIVTNPKLGVDAKVGSLATMPTVAKVDAVSAIAELQGWIDLMLEYIPTLIPWFRVPGIPLANIVGAWRGKGAASLADSYINLANPGTNDLAPGVAPTWDAVDGWTFNGTTQYLDTGLIPTNDQTWSMIVAFTGGPTTGLHCLCGEYDGAATQFNLYPSIFDTIYKVRYANGGQTYGAPVAAAGVMAIAGGAGYRDGLKEVIIPAGSYAITHSITLGCLNTGSPTQYTACKVQYFAIYKNLALTENQVRAITYAMTQETLVDNSVDLAARQAYTDQEFGAMISYSMPTFLADEATYAPVVDVNTFAPTGLDIDQWIASIQAAGCTYAVLTAKDPRGFCLWPTAYHVVGHDPYSIAQTSWYANNGQIDIVDQFVTKCRAAGITPYLYFCIRDYSFETYTGTTWATNAAAYIAMIETQLVELLTNYGTQGAIWFDGWDWWGGIPYIPYATIYNFIKALSPTTLIINNSHTNRLNTSQILTYEAAHQAIWANNLHPAENCMMIRNDGYLQYYYHAGVDQSSATLYSAASILSIMSDNAARNCASLISISVGTDGHVPAAQVTRLAEIGA